MEAANPAAAQTAANRGMSRSFVIVVPSTTTVLFGMMRPSVTSTTLTGNPTFNVDNGTQLVTLNLPALTDGGTTARTITKSGSGTLTLSGASTSTGLITINAGTLNVTGSLAGGGNLTVGTVTTVSGITAPFAATGQSVTGLNANGTGTINLSADGNLTVNATATFDLTKKRLVALEWKQDDLRDHFADHPVPAIGTLDAYQWVLLISGHTRRHTLQILEVKADPNFPKQ